MGLFGENANPNSNTDPNLSLTLTFGMTDWLEWSLWDHILQASNLTWLG